MIWLNPLALFALAAVAAPILIHILVQRRAERFLFPTLRFIAPTRLAAIRRHLLEDAALLCVRAALLAAAAAALAAPLILTAGRRHAWEQRTVRATVVDRQAVGSAGVQPGDRGAERAARPADATSDLATPVFREQRFEAVSLGDGIRRAVAWLDAAPPARRELVVASPFAIGSLTSADISAVPPNIGIRLERSGTLPASRVVDGGAVLAGGEAPSGARIIGRRITFSGPQTIVHESSAAGTAPWPIEVHAPPDAQPAVEAAVAAVLSQRVWQAPANHRARLVLLPRVSDTLQDLHEVSDTRKILLPWMAAAIARISQDDELQAAASRVANGFADTRLTTAPWYAVASAADGRPAAVAAASPSQLLFASAAGAADPATPLLIRSIANSLAMMPDLQGAEVVPISETVLRDWSRPAPAPGPPRVENVEQDDRRWLWLAVLALLAMETWMRRARTAAARAGLQESARVA